ncbi:hypothetical protein ALISP_1841 [Alicycliphilus sp. B1]|nr:hypothetical protein ALISP_1841 [Alicycliphilus sp. B1]
MDHAVHIDAAAHLHGAGEHHGLGLQAVRAQHGVRGAELASSHSASSTAGCDQLVQRLLVAHAVLDVAHEPAKPLAQGFLAPEKLLGEFHATLQSLDGGAMRSGAHGPCDPVGARGQRQSTAAQGGMVVLR